MKTILSILTFFICATGIALAQNEQIQQHVNYSYNNYNPALPNKPINAAQLDNVGIQLLNVIKEIAKIQRKSNVFFKPVLSSNKNTIINIVVFTLICHPLM